MSSEIYLDFRVKVKHDVYNIQQQLSCNQASGSSSFVGLWWWHSLPLWWMEDWDKLQSGNDFILLVFSSSLTDELSHLDDHMQPHLASLRSSSTVEHLRNPTFYMYPVLSVITWIFLNRWFTYVHSLVYLNMKSYFNTTSKNIVISSI